MSDFDPRDPEEAYERGYLAGLRDATIRSISSGGHDRYCFPGLGKPDPDECPHCGTARVIREDERRNIINMIEAL